MPDITAKATNGAAHPAPSIGAMPPAAIPAPAAQFVHTLGGS